MRFFPSISSSSPFRALAHRNYALFFTGHGLSLCGTWMQTLAMSWLVYRLSGSSVMLGLAEFFARAPILLLGVAGGVLADRWSRHRLMIASQTGLLVQATVIAALTLTNTVTIGWVLALALVLGMVSALEIPVRQSFVAELVPRTDLPSAIGLNSSLFNAARIVGPSLAGGVVAVAGEGLCFALNALSFLMILWCLRAMRLQPSAPRQQGHAMELFREGVQYAWRTPHVRAVLAITAVISVAATPYSTLLPVIVVNVLHRGPETLGFFMAAGGIGALAAAFRHAHRESVKGLGRTIGVSVGLLGGGMILLAISTQVWLSALALAVVGYGLISALAGINILLQSVVPDALRGRVVSFFTTLSLGVTVFGSLWGGIAAQYLGAATVIAIGGGVLVVTAAGFGAALPGLRRKVAAHEAARAIEVAEELALPTQR